MSGLDDVNVDDRHFSNISKRAANISTLEIIVKGLYDCGFDLQNKDFLSALILFNTCCLWHCTYTSNDYKVKTI